MEKAIRKIQVIIFRKNPNMEILMLKVIPERGGFWQCVTGKVEEGEEEMDAAFREVREETGISGDKVKHVLKDIYSFEYLKNNRKIHETVFGFEVFPDIEIDTTNNVYTEHTEYAWLSPEKAIETSSFDSQKQSILHLLNYGK